MQDTIDATVSQIQNCVGGVHRFCGTLWAHWLTTGCFPCPKRSVPDRSRENKIGSTRDCVHKGMVPCAIGVYGGVNNSLNAPIILFDKLHKIFRLEMYKRHWTGVREDHMPKTTDEPGSLIHEPPVLSEAALWQEAVAFVSEKRRKQIIEKIARKFMIYSPYGIEDYVAEAKMVAFEAMRLSLAKSDSNRMEGYFWTLLKQAFSRMSTNPSQADVVAGEDAGPLACIFEEYTEEWGDEDGTRPTGVSQKVTPLDKVMTRESLMGILVRKNLDKALESMTDREREVWALVLDGRSSQEISERLGSSRQNVEKLRERGLDKIKRNPS